VIGTWHSNYSDYLKFYHLNLIRTPVDKYIRSFYVNMPIYVPVSTHRCTAHIDRGIPVEKRAPVPLPGPPLALPCHLAFPWI
jgi:hypothetical protein